jgi:hypothetical protein
MPFLHEKRCCERCGNHDLQAAGMKITPAVLPQRTAIRGKAVKTNSVVKPGTEK